MVNNLSSYSQHLAEFPLLSIGTGSIPTHISNFYIFLDLIFFTEFEDFGILWIWWMDVVPGADTYSTPTLYITKDELVV